MVSAIAALILAFPGVLSIVSATNRCSLQYKRFGIPRFEPGPCPVELNLIDGKNAFCGRLIALQNRRAGHACGVVTLPVVRICPNVRESRRLRHSPIVHLIGGPGLSLMAYRTLLSGDFGVGLATRARRDFVFYDQRGGFLTTPNLNCAQLNAECVSNLTKRGVAIQTYNTRTHTLDLDDLRRVLGARRINVFGQSYGTQLAQQYARHFPHRIRSILLEASNWPAYDVFFTNSARSFEIVLKRVFRDCKMSTTCNTSFPNLERDYRELLKLPEIERKSFVLTLKVFLSHFGNAISSKSIAPLYISLERDLSRIGKVSNTSKEFTQVEQSLAELREALAEYERFIINFSVNAMRIVNCYDNVGLLSEAWDNLINGRLALRKVFRVQSAEELRKECSFLPKLRPPINNAPVRHSIPTLIISGTYDTVTPVEISRQINRDLHNSRLLVFPALGHLIIPLGNKCAIDSYLKFLKYPNLAAYKAPRCLASLRPTFEVNMDFLSKRKAPAM